MKWIGFICIILGSMGVGFCSVSEYKKQIDVLKKICEMMRYLQEAICNQYLPLPEAVKTCENRMQGEYKAFLQGVDKQLEKFSGEDIALIWKGQAEKLKGKLGKQYYDDFYHCMDQTGFSHADAQAETLKQYEKKLELEVKKLTEQQEEKCKLYQSLGVIGGVFICVLLL